jgi:acyl-CoA synthetase (AMP-forming)/AMP-acid ligase II
MLKRADVPRLRVCTSAGEALPADIGRRWTELLGIEILDGIGSTEMLHIFLSNRAGEVRYGTTGKPVPGYEVRLIGEDGNPVSPGQIGELQINGPSSAAMYWNNREKSRHTFMGDWTRSGDKYIESADGYFQYCGRSDDMLKVSGIYVSPFEVEGALMSHEADTRGRRRRPRRHPKLKVGLMLPYTGTFAALGTAIENGFKLHVEEQGGKLGGREIEFVKVDDESDPGQGHRQRQQAGQARQRRRAGRHRALGRGDGHGQGGQGQAARC